MIFKKMNKKETKTHLKEHTLIIRATIPAPNREIDLMSK